MHHLIQRFESVVVLNVHAQRLSIFSEGRHIKNHLLSNAFFVSTLIILPRIRSPKQGEGGLLPLLQPT